MAIKTKESVSRLVGIWIFLLLLIFKEIFPQPAYAFLSSLDACAANPECAAVVGSEVAPAVAAPSGAGLGASTLNTTTAAGTTTTFAKAVGRVAVVAGVSSVVGWHYWNQGNNQRAQIKAKEKYCSVYPFDSVCGSKGKSRVLYNYKFHETVHYRRSGYPDKFVTYHYRSWQPAPGPIKSLANQYPGNYFGGSYPPSGDYVGWIRLNDGVDTPRPKGNGDS